jgi:hypothetical protein
MVVMATGVAVEDEWSIAFWSTAHATVVAFLIWDFVRWARVLVIVGWYDDFRALLTGRVIVTIAFTATCMSIIVQLVVVDQETDDFMLANAAVSASRQSAARGAGFSIKTGNHGASQSVGIRTHTSMMAIAMVMVVSIIASIMVISIIASIMVVSIIASIMVSMFTTIVLSMWAIVVSVAVFIVVTVAVFIVVTAIVLTTFTIFLSAVGFSFRTTVVVVMFVAIIFFRIGHHENCCVQVADVVIN